MFSELNIVYMHSYAQGTWLSHDTRSLEFQLIGYRIQELSARYCSKSKETNSIIVSCIDLCYFDY